MKASSIIVEGVFFGADLEPGVFHGADLEPGVFHGAKLEPGTFHGADLEPGVFHGADLEPGVFHCLPFMLDGQNGDVERDVPPQDSAPSQSEERVEVQLKPERTAPTFPWGPHRLRFFEESRGLSLV